MQTVRGTRGNHGIDILIGLKIVCEVLHRGFYPTYTRIRNKPVATGKEHQLLYEGRISFIDNSTAYFLGFLFKEKFGVLIRFLDGKFQYFQVFWNFR